MVVLLLVKPIEVAQTTVLNGNIDDDKIRPVISDIQKEDLEPLLGTLLFKKILSDFDTNSLTGNYLELYEEFVKPILIYQTAAEYIELSSYSVDNGGIYRHQAENEEVPSRQDIEFFANKYRGKAQIRIERFYDWICKNPLPEYKTHQDEVNAQKDVRLMGGLYFGKYQDPTRWEREGNYIDRCDDCHNNDCHGC